MRIKLDENIPASLVGKLSDLGHNVDTVHGEGLSGKTDREVWLGAQEAARIFVTQDLDFSDRRQFAPGTHRGLILVRLRVPGTLALSRRLIEVLGTVPEKRWEGCFVLITDHKVRIHAG